MARTIYKRNLQNTSPTSSALLQETQVFLLHKIKAFYPELLLSLLFNISFFWIATDFSLQRVIRELPFTLVGDALLLKMTGIVTPIDQINSVIWYLSSMLIGLSVLYPLVRRLGVSLSLFILSLCLLGAMLHFSGKLSRPFHPIGWTLQGNLRAFSEMAIGACLLPVSERLANVNLRSWCRWGLSVFKIILIALLIFLQHRQIPQYESLFLTAAGLLLVIIFSRQDADSRAYDNALFLWLGKLSLPLFLCHRAYVLHLPQILPKDCSKLTYATCALSLSLMTALLVMYAAHLFRVRLVETGHFKRCFIKP